MHMRFRQALEGMKTDFLANRKVILVHYLTALFALFSFGFCIVDFIVGRPGIAVFLGLTSLSMWFAYYENNRGRTRLPENLTMINGTLLFCFLFLPPQSDSSRLSSVNFYIEAFHTSAP